MKKILNMRFMDKIGSSCAILAVFMGLTIIFQIADSIAVAIINITAGCILGIWTFHDWSK